MKSFKENVRGTGILGASDIVKQTKVKCHPNSAYLITEAGGTVEYFSEVVSDQRIITGGIGGGFSNGDHTKAPYPELSSELTRNIMDLSYYSDSHFETVSSNEFSLQIQTDILSSFRDILPEIGNTAIDRIKVLCYPPKNYSAAETVELTLLEPNLFELNFTITGVGEKILDIEMYSSTGNLDIVRNLYAFRIPKSISGFPVIYLLSIAIFVSLLYSKSTQKSQIRKF